MQKFKIIIKMKKYIYLKTLTIILLLFLVSCKSYNYYQVYKTMPITNEALSESGYVYSDTNCSIFYNFWSNNGDMGFRFYNKTNMNLYLNLEECFFVCNGIAYDYYLNRTWGNSSSVSTSASKGYNYSTAYSASASMTGYNYLNLIQTNALAIAEILSKNSTYGLISSTEKSTEFREKKIICVPPHCSKIISEYFINNTVLRYCNLFLYPNKKNINTLTFNIENSPIIFSNRLSYSKDNLGDLIRIENTFYVVSITNYPQSSFLEYKYETICGQEIDEIKTSYKIKSPDSFYIKYMKTDNLIH